MTRSSKKKSWSFFNFIFDFYKIVVIINNNQEGMDLSILSSVKYCESDKPYSTN